MKAAVFSCKGLGDGLISLALANNLHLNDYRVDTFHINLDEIQSIFPHLKINKYPNIEEIDNILSTYDQIFISYDESNHFIMKLIEDGKKFFPKKIYVLNPCPSRRVGDQPYFGDALFDPNICMVNNIEHFCKRILKLEKTSMAIKISMPTEYSPKKYTKRIVIHPSSAKESKNLPIKKYIKLAKDLKSKGYDPVFVISSKEKKDFEIVSTYDLNLCAFDNLKDLASFVYESFYMLGNDSGIGHLASLFNLPTISIFRNYRSAKLWRPGWSRGSIVYPNRYIPNLFFYRLRDKHWKSLIPCRKIIKTFQELNY